MSIKPQFVLRPIVLVCLALALCTTVPPLLPTSTRAAVLPNRHNAPRMATVVTNCTDAGLNAAITAGGTVTFNCPSPYTINITTQKTIASNVTIDGSNNGHQLTFDGGNSVRPFYVATTGTLTLNNLKITHGNALGAAPTGTASYGGGIYNAGTLALTYVFLDSNVGDAGGGGIYNAAGATATLNQAYFSFNSSNYGGGGLFNDGTLSGINSGGFSNNTTNNYGGAIFYNSGNSSISYATFDGNTAGSNGGALYTNNGSLSIDHSTSFTNNQAGLQGGAIYDGFSNSNMLRIANTTFTGNKVIGADSASSFGGDAQGGAIYTYRNDDISISNSTFATNSVKGGNGNGNYGGDADGGAIYHHGTGTMTITASIFDQNTATGGNGGMNGGGDASGGAINGDYGPLVVLTSTLSSNLAHGGIGYGNGSGDGSGGAIYNSAGRPYTIVGSTFTSNVAQGGDSGGYGGGRAFGGALFQNNNGAPVLANSTLFGNSAIGGTGGASRSGGDAYGGGIYSYAGGDNLTVTNSTISQNTALGGSGTPAGTNYGSGIYGGSSGSGVTIANTIISGNALGANCNGLVVDGGYNLEYTFTTCGLSSVKHDQTGDPKLGPPLANGGPTQTEALSPGSAAIDNGSDSLCAAAPINNLDQRGFPRPFGVHCDIGSYEFIFPTVATAFTPATIGSGSSSVLSFTLTNLSGVAVNNGSFTDTLPSQITLRTIPTGNCGGTINVSGNTITVSGVNLDVGASCTITATVTASMPGTYFNTTSALSTTQYGTAGTASTTTLTVNGPAVIVAQAGSGQTTQINTAFAHPLQAKVTDTNGNPIVGTSVTFLVPGSGASCVFAGGTGSSTATTDDQGIATALNCTANGTVGSYTVQATTPGVATPANFHLTNSLTATTPTPVIWLPWVQH